MDATDGICIETPNLTPSPTRGHEDRNENIPQTTSMEREDTLSFCKSIKVVDK